MRIAPPDGYFISATSSPRGVSLLRPLLSLQTLAFVMAGAPESVEDPSAADLEDLKFGFRRPEMHKGPLAGTVDPPYDRHVFLCYKSPESWPSRVEDSQSDLLPKLLASVLKSRKNDIGVKTRLTICEGIDGADGDVLIFPEMIKYRGLKDLDVDSFVEDVLVNGKSWGSGVQEVLTGSHVFVCAHGSRDQRCGVCGPALIKEFKEKIEVRGLEDKVFISPCSHIGGHKYAGNLIIFSPNQEGKIMGHWYGYVSPNDVTELLDQHIGRGEIIERLWRGQMGTSPKEGENLSEEKLLNGKESKKNKKKFKESITQGTGCCQGANGSSCCRDGNLDIPAETYTGKLSRWLNSWEQGDVLAAAAIVGAVATVAAACSLYKRSS